jgi:hypothetical protein
MAEPSESDGNSSIVTLESLPTGALSMTQLDALDEAAAIDIAAPLAIDTTTSRVSHFDLVVDDTYHYLGWNLTEDQWEQLLVVVDTEDALVLESAISVYDDESGELKIGFDPNGNPEVVDIVAFVWEYVEYTYPETDTLYNVMDDALDDLSTDESSR